MSKDNAPLKIGAARSIYYSLTEEVPGLTEEEKAKLEAVMQKAQEFEVEEAIRMRQPVEGQLYKYTNVVKGWQYRWFVLTPDAKMLEYYMLDDRKKNRPRGGLHLEGAVVSLSDEDSQSFVVSATCGEVYKLKASDPKERQFWTGRIQSVIESNEMPKKEMQLGLSPSPFGFCKGSSYQVSGDQCPQVGSDDISSDPVGEIGMSVCSALDRHKKLAKCIEGLPSGESNIKCSDSRLLLIKAISQASVQSLEQCYLILRTRQQRESLPARIAPMRTSLESLDKMKPHAVLKKESRKTEAVKSQ